MIVLPILSTIAAIAWSAIIVMANGMSDAPTMGFQGGGMLMVVWIGVAALWLAWWIG
jgi:hypothetical protein